MLKKKPGLLERNAKFKWVTVRPLDPDTLPPPFKRVEIETHEGAIYRQFPWYTHGYAIRDYIDGLSLPLIKRRLAFNAVVRWRLTDAEE
jgi:hypothetical protein